MTKKSSFKNRGGGRFKEHTKFGPLATFGSPPLQRHLPQAAPCRYKANSPLHFVSLHLDEMRNVLFSSFILTYQQPSCSTPPPAPPFMPPPDPDIPVPPLNPLKPKDFFFLVNLNTKTPWLFE